MSSSKVVQLAREMIRAPSPSGREGPAVEVLTQAMRQLGFDRVWVDDAGNAIGAFDRGAGPTVMMNGHVDTVPVGDESAWPHPPLSGDVVDGSIWGRGASDMKSSIAAMAVAAADAVDRGFTGTLMVSGVVQEEVGGLGAHHLASTVPYDVVILGEPSSMQLMMGHRGRIEVDVDIPGRIAHAAKAELGVNALYGAAAWLRKLESITLPEGGPLRRSTATPTRLVTFPVGGSNVVPGRATITVDYRNLPSDPPDEVLARLAALDPEATLTVQHENAVSESGLVSRSFPRIAQAYLAPGESRWANESRAVLREALPAVGREFVESTWWFATDAPHLSTSGGGAPVLGFGPGDPELAHTTFERVDVSALEASVAVYAAWALHLSRVHA